MIATTCFDMIINIYIYFSLGKYYLVDAGYTNMRGFLFPFRNVHYWLQDFQGVDTDFEEDLG